MAFPKRMTCPLTMSLWALTFLLLDNHYASICEAFAIHSHHAFIYTRHPTSPPTRAAVASSLLRLHAKKSSSNPDDSFLMDDYRDPVTGEVMDPYQVLKIDREADRQTIKNAYRAESRRYHPDVVRFKTILPGRCNNLEEVRDQWERVKLSYEILYDTKSRKRYDRHWALADPGRAVQRAASQAAADAVVSMGKGIWGLGKGIGKGMVRGAAVAASKAKYEYKKNQRMKARRLTTESSTIIPQSKTQSITKEQSLRYVELEMRARIDDTLQAASATERSALFSNTMIDDVTTKSSSTSSRSMAASATALNAAAATSNTTSTL